MKCSAARLEAGVAGPDVAGLRVAVASTASTLVQARILDHPGCAQEVATMRADLALDPANQVGPVDRCLFGTFVGQMGRCVYTGIYEPGHPTADADGFRGDVLELVRELGASTLRYPGG